MSVGIIGLGFVGSAYYQYFKDRGETIYGYDILPERDIDGLEKTISADYIFLCLPTPMGSLGCDLTYVYSFFESLPSINKEAIWILKSTVPPGTTDILRETYDIFIYHSPEFLRANFALSDLQQENSVIFGIPFGIGADSQRIKSLFVGKEVYFCSAKESELLKYFRNVFLATKVFLNNAFYFTCLENDSSWTRIKELMVLDPRMGNSHMNVPGDNNAFGYGGYCFPKDVDAFIQFVPAYFQEWCQLMQDLNSGLRENPSSTK